MLYLGIWEKPVTDMVEIGKALLECGMATPYNTDPENYTLSLNQMTTIDAYMFQLCFRYK